MAPARRHAVTLTDLLIVLVMLALVAPGVLQLIHRTGRQAPRIKCASNLRQIGVGIVMYAAENKGIYPRTIYEVGTQPTQYTSALAANPFGADGPGPNDVTAPLFLLMRAKYFSTADVFVCPSTDRVAWDFGGKTAQQVSNFPGERHLSYSCANPYSDATAADRGFRMQRLTPGFVVAADMNPGQGGGYDIALPKSPSAPPQEMAKANTRNHNGAGQNVLYADASVRWQQNPFVGVNQDNIYTSAGGAEPNFTTTSPGVGLPRWSGDSVLLPVAVGSPNSRDAVGGRGTNRVLIVGGIVLLVGIGIAVFLVVLRKPKPVVSASAASPPPP
jgi:hypothetical protein